MKKDGRSVSRETLEQYRFRALELRDLKKIWEKITIKWGKISLLEGKNIVF